jgi:hypothetical protein
METAVSWFVMVTGASGTAAPEGSSTWPRNVPVVLCADAGFESNSAKAAAINTKMDRPRQLRKV